MPKESSCGLGSDLWQIYYSSILLGYDAIPGEYTSKTGKVAKVGQLLYDLKKRRIMKEYSVLSATGCVKTRVFKNWITTSSLGLKGKVVIL